MRKGIRKTRRKVNYLPLISPSLPIILPHPRDEEEEEEEDWEEGGRSSRKRKTIGGRGILTLLVFCKRR